MNPKVDSYFAVGCGRCPLGGTPDCKVHNWQEEMEHLRTIILSCSLTEELKWGVPCYTFQSKNVLILSAFKEYCSISFFKGALLKDANSILEKPGENTQAARLIKFTKVQQVIDLEETIKNYILEAIEIEKAGLTVDFKEKSEIEYPEELQDKLNEDPELKKAFEALTPGRQRGYILYFTQPKQAKTRVSRIEKCAAKIFEGKGLQDR
ncbi:MAG: hypothetical protein CMO01_19055 [Thalassobius sp.]|nr:hypothetical protein [Thalassovita sp.]